MSNILSRPGVEILEGEEAQEILHEYLGTGPQMVLAVHPTATQQPQGTGAGDKMIRPGG